MLKINELKEQKVVYDLKVDKNFNFFANDILVHNCTEIVEYTKASKLKSTKLTYDENKKPIITKEYEAGEIALCNLASLNLYELYNGNLTDDEIFEKIFITLESMDATFDVQYYPVIEGKYSNDNWRYIGIGFLNYAKLLASEGIIFGSKQSKEYTAELMDDDCFKIYKASNELAKKKGKFNNFHLTHWVDGKTPLDFANKKALKLTEFQPDMKKWKKLGKSIKEHGMRFALHIAIAPTACQTLDSKIKANNTIMSYKNICELNNIDYNFIEKNNSIGWYHFNKPLIIDTRFGKKLANKIYYNGKQYTKKITFEDNENYNFTYNHMLLNDKNRWKEVSLLQVNDLIKTIDGTKKIIKIEKDNELKPTWDIEVEKVAEYILSNGCISHNTSGVAINSTPSIEPIFDYVFKEEGQGSVVTLTPNLKEYGASYKTAFEIDNKDLVELAAIRQIYMDQAQSINLYFQPPFSLKKQTEIHFYAHNLGIKTLYYFQTKKDGDDDICDSCS